MFLNKLWFKSTQRVFKFWFKVRAHVIRDICLRDPREISDYDDLQELIFTSDSLAFIIIWRLCSYRWKVDCRNRITTVYIDEKMPRAESATSLILHNYIDRHLLRYTRTIINTYWCDSFVVETFKTMTGPIVFVSEKNTTRKFYVFIFTKGSGYTSPAKYLGREVRTEYVVWSACICCGPHRQGRGF